MQSLRVKFDAFVLDPNRGQLFRGDRLLHLRRQSFDVLLHLANHAGTLVSSDDLIAAVWSSRPANATASVAQCIKEIRYALGQDARWIVKTVSGGGYQFMVEVCLVTDEASVHSSSRSVPSGVRFPALPREDVEAAGTLSRGPAPNAAKSPPPRLVDPLMRPGQIRRSPASVFAQRHGLLLALAIAAILLVSTAMFVPHSALPRRSSTMTMMAAPTIAILPLTVSGPADPGVAAAIGEDLRIELLRAARGYDLVIKSPLSELRGPDGKSDILQLGVRYAVSGAMRHEQQSHFLDLQLLEPETGRMILSASHKMPTGDGTAMNREVSKIAQSIALHVRTVESQRALPQKLEAGHYVLLARHMSQTRSAAAPTLEALDLYDKALELEPNSIKALEGWARLALRSVNSGYLEREQIDSALAKVQAKINLLLAIESRNSVAHALRGDYFRAQYDWDNAIAAYEYALSLDPNHVWAHGGLARTKIEVGQSHAALKHAEDAIAVSPVHSFHHILYFYAGMAAVHLGDERAAISWLLKARQADMTYPFSALWLAIAFVGAGEDEKARATYAEFAKDRPDFTVTKWLLNLPTKYPIVAGQRARIADHLRRLGVPERKPNGIAH